jgi:hypothetical protein
MCRPFPYPSFQQIFWPEFSHKSFGPFNIGGNPLSAAFSMFLARTHHVSFCTGKAVTVKPFFETSKGTGYFPSRAAFLSPHLVSLKTPFIVCYRLRQKVKFAFRLPNEALSIAGSLMIVHPRKSFLHSCCFCSNDAGHRLHSLHRAMGQDQRQGCRAARLSLHVLFPGPCRTA